MFVILMGIFCASSDSPLSIIILRTLLFRLLFSFVHLCNERPIHKLWRGCYLLQLMHSVRLAEKKVHVLIFSFFSTKVTNRLLFKASGSRLKYRQ